MSSPGVTFNLTCGKGVTELQNLANLRLSSFAESHRMQQKDFDVSPNFIFPAGIVCMNCVEAVGLVGEEDISQPVTSPPPLSRADYVNM